MPVSKPTIAAAAGEATAAGLASAQAATDAICDYVDTANAATVAAAAAASAAATTAGAAATKASILAWATAVQQYILVTNTYKPNAEPIPAALSKAFADLATALAP